MKATLLLLFSAAVIFAQVVPGRYILELSGDPAAVTASRQTARPGARAGAGVLAANRAAVRQLQIAARTAVAARGGTVVESLDTVFNGLIVNIPDARAAELLQIPGVVKLHTVRRVRPSLAHALPLHRVPDAWNLLPLGQNSAGAGIKIAIIDTGIDYTHANFKGPGTVAAYAAAKATGTLPANPTLFGPAAPRVKGGTDLVGDDYNADPDDPNFQPIPHPNGTPGLVRMVLELDS